MRGRSLLLLLTFASACAHSRTGASGNASTPVAPQTAVTAPGAIQLYLPESAEYTTAFEVRPGAQQADRIVGGGSRQAFLRQFDDLRRVACAHGVRLVLVAHGPGNSRDITQDIRFAGALELLAFDYSGIHYEGAEIPCPNQ